MWKVDPTQLTHWSLLVSDGFVFILWCFLRTYHLLRIASSFTPFVKSLASTSSLKKCLGAKLNENQNQTSWAGSFLLISTSKVSATSTLRNPETNSHFAPEIGLESNLGPAHFIPTPTVWNEGIIQIPWVKMVVICLPTMNYRVERQAPKYTLLKTNMAQERT